MSVFVKNVYIEVPEYNFSCDDNSKFIGREKAQDNLKRRIKPSKTGKYKGAYLVAGYRGMGKSTLVDNVVEEINKTKKKSIMSVKISLSQGELNAHDLLRQMFIRLSTELIDEYGNNSTFKIGFPYLIIISVCILYFVNAFTSFDFYSLFWETRIEFMDFLFLSNHINSLSFILVFGSICFSFLFSFKKLLEFIVNYLKRKKNKLFLKIREVNKRLNSELELNNNNSESSINEDSIPYLNFFKSLTANLDVPYRQTFQKISAKELEFEIIEILKLYDKYRKPDTLCILFIIDELDKLEPDFIEYQENSGKSRIQSRRDNVSRVLGDLKNFIHESKAKFIFIGGAEMYDASLADIADRESFYSSIFHEVIYLNSFFKDFENKKGGLVQMTESYLIGLLLKKTEYDKENSEFTLKTYYDFLKSENYLEKDFIIYQLFHFIYYLNHRSNGSPKKLKELIEYYLVQKIKKDEEDKQQNISVKLDKVNFSKERNEKHKAYLRLEYTQQFKIGMLSSIVFPYILQNQTHIKIFNDKNLYLSAFLIDHILKFHKSAFSWREIELTPDIIMGGKGPNLRNTLKGILTYLSQNHIRTTTNAMFQYKFRSRTRMELEYVSRISDESAAAFNFTYDESYHLKIFFKRKLKKKIELYNNNDTVSNDNFIHSVAYLNSTIADLHFYDEEYDTAIRYYADAIQSLRDNFQKTSELNNHQKVLFTRNRLMLSLALEKTHRFDSTYSIVRSTILDVTKWSFKEDLLSSNEYINNQSLDIIVSDSRYNKSKSWESPYKRMQLFLRPHLSLLMIIEKERSDGITENNLKRNIHEYGKFMELVDLFPYEPFKINTETHIYRGFAINSKGADHKRIETLLADYYQNVGSLLFYKNRNFKSIHEYGSYGIWNKFLKIQKLSLFDDKMQHREIKIGDNYLTLQDRVNYLSLDNIRRAVFSEKAVRFYIPSFTATFYYIISLNHIMNPYKENIKSILNKTKEEDSLFDLIETLLFEDKARHVLNGKQKELLGLTLGKLSDAILACLGKVEFNLDKNTDMQTKSLFDLKSKFWDLEKIGKKPIAFDKFFSVNMVFYLSIMSSRSYLLAESYYDSLFNLKKCLYVIKTHFETLSVKAPLLTIKLTELIELKSNRLIKRHLRSYVTLKEDHFDNISQTKYCLNNYKEIDSEEIEYLTSIIYLKCFDLGNTSLPIYTRMRLGKVFVEIKNEKNTLKSIYLRIQKLRYTSFILSRSLKFKIECFRTRNYLIPFIGADDLIFDICELNLCFTNLINIIKTYGFTYVMSYSYIASLYLNIYVWSKRIIELEKYFNDNGILYSIENTKYSHFWSFQNPEYYRVTAIDFFYKSVGIHSEGIEYKSTIRDMYLLEDDLNDSLTHFCAALERSIINTGIVEAKLSELEK